MSQGCREGTTTLRQPADGHKAGDCRSVFFSVNSRPILMLSISFFFYAPLDGRAASVVSQFGLVLTWLLHTPRLHHAKAECFRKSRTRSSLSPNAVVEISPYREFPIVPVHQTSLLFVRENTETGQNPGVTCGITFYLTPKASLDVG